MLFVDALLGSLLLISVVLAAPSRQGAHLAHRREGRRSRVNNRLGQTAGPVSDVEYSKNWAGAVWADGNETFTSVTGTFTVPTPSGSMESSAAAWVGIDGDTCTSAILQTGVSFTVSESGSTYDAWYEFYPAPSFDYSGITISAGDVIKLTVTASSPYKGTVTIENLTNSERVSQNVTSVVPLCRENAEWIVEDYEEGNSIVPFANFSTVTFTNATASGNGTYTPSGATIVDIQQNNQVLTSISTNGSSVTIKYV